MWVLGRLRYDVWMLDLSHRRSCATVLSLLIATLAACDGDGELADGGAISDARTDGELDAGSADAGPDLSTPCSDCPECTGTRQIRVVGSLDGEAVDLDLEWTVRPRVDQTVSPRIFELTLGGPVDSPDRLVVRYANRNPDIRGRTFPGDAELDLATLGLAGEGCAGERQSNVSFSSAGDSAGTFIIGGVHGRGGCAEPRIAGMLRGCWRE